MSRAQLMLRHVIGLARMILVAAACSSAAALANPPVADAQQAATKPKRAEIGGETAIKSILWVGRIERSISPRCFTDGRRFRILAVVDYPGDSTPDWRGQGAEGA